MIKISPVILLCLSITVGAAVSPNAGKVSLWARQGNTSTTSNDYDSAVYLPQGYDASTTRQYPLVLTLHGLGGSVLNTYHTAVGGQRSGFIKQVWGTALASTYRGIVIAPNRSPRGSSIRALWSHAELRQLIIEAKRKYKIDPNRVVVTGYSAGSIASQQLLRYSKDLVAAAMPGAYDPSPLGSSLCSAADVPVWVFGNSSDSLFRSTMWKSAQPKIEACSNYIYDFSLTVYSSTCGHGCWDNHWKRVDVQQWLINQSK